MSPGASPELIESVAGLRAAQQRRSTAFSITPAPRPSDWALRDGALQHSSGGFFAVSGFVERGTDRQHLLLHQPQGAVNGWVSRRVDGQRHYLVQARAEPGNVDGVQFGPTLQSTPANYLRLHGGAASPFADIFLRHTPGICLLFDTQQLDQGGRYAQKTKRVCMVEMAHPLAEPRGFHWATAEALAQATDRDFLLNTDFKAGLAVLPWSAEPASGELVPASGLVRDSLVAPIRPQVMGAAVASVQGPQRPLEAIPLESLDGWRVTDAGIEPVGAGRRISVGFFECTADAREVTRWVQPLLRAPGAGLAALAARVQDGVLEVFVAAAREPGLPMGAALGTSHLSYPGEPVHPPAWMARATPWIGTRESDEGGRFLDHWSDYRVLMIADGVQIDTPGTWLRVSELKAVLGMSNLCTIQLRTMAALLLAAPDCAP